MTNASSLTSLLFAIFALAVVLALAWLILKGLASLNQRRSLHSPMRIKATLPLGNRERLMVVEYRENDYLLGVASGSITRIDKQPKTESKDVPSNPDHLHPDHVNPDHS